MVLFMYIAIIFSNGKVGDLGSTENKLFDFFPFKMSEIPLRQGFIHLKYIMWNSLQTVCSSSIKFLEMSGSAEENSREVFFVCLNCANVAFGAAADENSFLLYYWLCL